MCGFFKAKDKVLAIDTPTSQAPNNHGPYATAMRSISFKVTFAL